jgi:hypothetical protein
LGSRRPSTRLASTGLLIDLAVAAADSTKRISEVAALADQQAQFGSGGV